MRLLGFGRFGLLLLSFSISPGFTQKVHTDRSSALPLTAPTESEAFQFVVFGDRTGGPKEGIKILAEAVRDTNRLAPDFVMTVGDLINGYNQTKAWMNEMEEFHETMDELHMPWYPVAGNHDVYWRGPEAPPIEHEEHYEEHFGPLWYWFEHKRCGFLVLYTDEGHPDGRPRSFSDPEQQRMSEKQVAWLKSSLAKMKGLQHVFVFLHHPRWQTARYRGSDWDRIHRILAANGNVRAVMAGHIHQLTYSGKRDGIDYFSLATTGGHIPGGGGEIPLFGFLHHLNVVTVRPDSTNGYDMAVVPVGATIDPKRYTAEYEADVRALRAVLPAFTGEPVTLDANFQGTGALEVRVENPSPWMLEIDLQPQMEGGWTFTPESQFFKIPPGETMTRRIGAERKAVKTGYRSPRIVCQRVAVAEGARIDFGQRILNVPVQLDLEFADLPKAEPGFMHVKPRHSLRVDHERFTLPDGAFTLEAWLNPRSARQKSVPLAKTESSEFNIELKEGHPVFYVHLNGKYTTVKGKDPLPVGTWSHVAAVFDGKAAILYVNGEEAGRVSASGKRTTNRLPFYIGADPDRHGRPSRWFAGGLDEVRLSKGAVYEKPFDPEKILKRRDDTIFLFHLDQQYGSFFVSDSDPIILAEPIGSRVELEKHK